MPPIHTSLPTHLALEPLPHQGAEEPAEPPFTTAGEAWLWAVEVLRRRRLPTSPHMWRDDIAMRASQRAALQQPEKINIAAEATLVAEQWGTRFSAGNRANLPTCSEGRYGLAQKIQQLQQGLPPAAARLLALWAWGDWADDARLRAALAVQEKARREGLKVRLSYRYSATQLAGLMGCSKATAWRQLHGALKLLEDILRAERVVAAAPCGQRPSPNTPAKPVRRQAFKG